MKSIRKVRLWRQDASQQRLLDAKSALAKLEPHFKTDLAEDEALIRYLTLRVARDPEAASAVELEIYEAVLKAGLDGRDFELDDVRPIKPGSGGKPKIDSRPVQPIKQGLEKAKQKKPVVRTKPRKVPGKTYPEGAVELTIEGRKTTIFEIPSPAGGFSPVQRADIVTKRIRQAMAADPKWYLSLEVGQVRGMWVVKNVLAREGYIVTADPTFARMRGMSAQRLASKVTTDIRQTIGEPGMGGRSVEPTEVAAAFREAGDDAYVSGNIARAEEQWKSAIEAHPDYLLPYERLANLYKEQGKTAAAREMAEKAVTLPELTADEQRSLHTLLATLKKP